MQEPNGNTPIKVLLADDHTMFREGLAVLLASYGGLEIVGETTNDEGAVELAHKKKPDVVVMQVQLPFERAKKSLSRMREILPPPKVVICTMFENPGYVRELMNLGVSAYIVKSSSAEHLLGAIRAAVFDPKGQHVVVGMPQQMLEQASEGSASVLSAREMEVLLLAARGLSNRHIAELLTLSEATIKRHLANSYPKMRVHSRGEAIREALTEGWITIRDVTQDEQGEVRPKGRT